MSKRLFLGFFYSTERQKKRRGGNTGAGNGVVFAYRFHCVPLRVLFSWVKQCRTLGKRTLVTLLLAELPAFCGGRLAAVMD